VKRFRNIVYVSEPALDQETPLARAVALARNNQAHLTIIEVLPGDAAGMVIPSGESGLADSTAAMVRERRARLEASIAAHREHTRIGIEIRMGKQYLEVIRAVLRDHHDLVIKPAEDPDFMARLFGSDDMHLLRKCPCPVWLMKPREKSNYQRIVAAVDLTLDATKPDKQGMNRQILELASSLALSDFAELHIVHAWEAPEAGFVSIWADKPDAAERDILEGERRRRQSGMDTLTRGLRERLGEQAYDYLSPRVHLPMGNAKREIPALVSALEADLVVMGTVARTGISGFIIGNTAEAILDQLQCSVLAIKPEGFASPVTLP
jgi:universal stress protein E